MLLGSTILNTLAILESIRGRFGEGDDEIHAYIVPNNGPHFGAQANCERRIRAVSNFTGSAGSVIITGTQALLWTDGRYITQAGIELDEDVWTIMHIGQDLTEAEWLLENLPEENGRVVVDPSLYPKSAWDSMVAVLGDKLDGTITENFVDTALAANGLELPACPAGPIHQLEIEFTGLTVAEKLTQVRAKMAEERAQLLLLSELDEIAWLFNLRGTDMPPQFYAYAVIGLNSATLIVKQNTIEATIVADLATANVEVRQSAEKHYETATVEFVDLMSPPAVERVWISKYANQLMANQPREGVTKIFKLSPVALLKAVKNSVEVEGMKKAHLRDSAAIVTFLSWLEKRVVDEGAEDINEISAAEELLRIRSLENAHFVSQSFSTISAFGPSGAIIHYRPTENSNRPIATGGMYLVDSGGQYKDGTTDITRSIFLGNPGGEHKEMFTRVLKGHIAVATSFFPNKVTGNRLDSLARKSLWDAKVDYAHGTGHGIGMYMNVHEGPQNMGVNRAQDDTGLEANMFMSNEPGYYKVGEYGIRIENIVRVSTVENAEGFLEFETVSFVPMQLKLIDLDLLTAEEIQWVDDYHTLCRDKVGGYIRETAYFQEKETALDWLEKATVTLGEFNSGTHLVFSSVTLFAILVIQHLLPKCLL